MDFPSYVPQEVRDFLSTEMAARQRDLEHARLRTDPEGRAVASELRKRIKVVTALATDERMRTVYESPLPQSEEKPSPILEVVWAAVRASLDQRKNAEVISAKNQAVDERCQKLEAVVSAFEGHPHGGAVVREAETALFFAPLEKVGNRVTELALSRKRCPHREFLRAFYGRVISDCIHKEIILALPHAMVGILCDVATGEHSSEQDVSEAKKDIFQKQQV
jgi:hypothetical protein